MIGQPPFRLYYFHRAGCHFCEAASPIVDAFALAHPEGMVIRTNAGLRKEVLEFEPEGTPAYLFVPSGGGEQFEHVGMLSLEEMEQALREIRPDDEDDVEQQGHEEDEDGKPGAGSDEEE